MTEVLFRRNTHNPDGTAREVARGPGPDVVGLGVHALEPDRFCSFSKFVQAHHEYMETYPETPVPCVSDLLVDLAKLIAFDLVEVKVVSLRLCWAANRRNRDTLLLLGRGRPLPLPDELAQKLPSNGGANMPKLTPQQKFQKARERMIEKAKEYSTGTYVRKFVAPLFQQMIRAEAAAMPEGLTTTIINGDIGQAFRQVGQCACVTCGTVKAWDSGIKGIHCGHFLASRCNSILFEEDNVAPQCSACNYYRSGEQQLFRKWMLAVRPEAVERLERLKATSRTFTREELVDMRISYKTRLDAAIERIQ